MNSKLLYTVTQRNFLLLGALLVILGSFLPWEVEGDFLSHWRYGIQFFPVVADHGGMIVLLFGILILGLVFRSEGIVKYPVKWILASAIALCILSAYHIVDWLVRRNSAHGIVGAPAIRIGLIMVGIGSILLLATAFVMNSKGSANHVQE
jgi:hypothetical protein